MAFKSVKNRFYQKKVYISFHNKRRRLSVASSKCSKRKFMRKALQTFFLRFGDINFQCENLCRIIFSNWLHELIKFVRSN